jgi:hypothetical protein
MYHNQEQYILIFMPKNIGRTNANSDVPSVTLTTEFLCRLQLEGGPSPKVAMYFVFCRLYPSTPSHHHAVFGSYLSYLLRITGAGLLIHMFGEVSWELKNNWPSLSITPLPLLSLWLLCTDRRVWGWNNICVTQNVLTQIHNILNISRDSSRGNVQIIVCAHDKFMISDLSPLYMDIYSFISNLNRVKHTANFLNEKMISLLRYRTGSALAFSPYTVLAACQTVWHSAALRKKLNLGKNLYIFNFTYASWCCSFTGMTKMCRGWSWSWVSPALPSYIQYTVQGNRSIPRGLQLQAWTN